MSADMRLAKPQLDPQLDLTAQAAAQPLARVAHTDLIAVPTIRQNRHGLYERTCVGEGQTERLSERARDCGTGLPPAASPAA